MEKNRVDVRVQFDRNMDKSAVASLSYLDKYFKVYEEPLVFRGVQYSKVLEHKVTKEAYLVTDDGKVNWVDGKGKRFKSPYKDGKRLRFGSYANKLFAYIIVAYAYNYKSDILKSLHGNSKYQALVINHMDLDSSNNHPSNLEIVTVSENTIHAKLYSSLLNQGLIVPGARVSAQGLYAGLIDSYNQHYSNLLEHLVMLGNIHITDTILK